MFRRLLHPRSVATVAGVTLAVKIRNADCSPWWWPIPVNYKALRADIEKLIDADEERRNDGTSIAPVSAAWLLANLAPHVFSLADIHQTCVALLRNLFRRRQDWW